MTDVRISPNAAAIHVEGDIPSVAGVLKVTLIFDSSTNQYSSDKTFAEIYSAYESGAYLFARSNEGDVCTLTYIDDSGCVFTNSYYEDGMLYGSDFTINSAGVSSIGWTIVSAGS